MDLGTKIFLVIAFLIVDFIVFFIPLSTILILVIIFAKPLWFKKFIDELYSSKNKIE